MALLSLIITQIWPACLLLIKGHDVISAQQLKEAIDSYGGVRGCRAVIVEVNTKKQTTGTHKISGISQLNNVQYSEDGEKLCGRRFKLERVRGSQSKSLVKWAGHRAIQGENRSSVLWARWVYWDAEENIEADVWGSACSHHACYTTCRSGGLSVV